MLFLPDTFFYEDKQYRDRFSSNPSGIIDVNRLVNGLPFWRQAGLSKIRKKKALVLADWRATLWSKYQTHRALEIIEQLIDEGFPVYIWQHGGEVLPVTKSNISSLNIPRILDRITPAFPQEIIQATNRMHKHTCEGIQVIDEYWWNALCSGLQYLPQRYLMSSNLLQISQNHRTYCDLSYQEDEYSKIFAIGHQSTPKLFGIILDTFPALIPPDLPKEMAILPLYQNLYLDKDGLTQLLSTGVIMNQANPHFRYTQLLNITGLTIASACTAEALKTLLSQVPNLQTLTLRVPNVLSSLTEPVRLPYLKEINIEGGHFSFVDIEFLLKSAPNLESMYIGQGVTLSFGLFFDGDFLFEKSYPNIKTLHLDMLGIHLQDLKALILSLPNLEHLIIHDYSFTEQRVVNSISSDVIFSFLHTLPCLKELDLKHCAMQSTTLQQFLISAPNLQSLDITSSTINGELDVGLSLPFLSKVYASQCYMLPQNLNRILKATQQLAILDLTGCEQLDDVFDETIHWSELQELHVAATNLTTAQLESILCVSSKMRLLNIRECIKLVHGLTQTLTLPELTFLDASNSSLPTPFLLTLLSGSPHIKHLALEDCIDGTLDEDDMDGKMLPESITNMALSELVYFNISTLDVSAITLQVIFQKATELEELDMHECVLFDDFEGGEPFKLEKLQKIDIGASNVSIMMLETLMKAAPNLREISLEGCYNLQGQFSKNFIKNHALNQLLIIRVNQCKLSTEAKNALQTIAPNAHIRAQSISAQNIPVVSTSKHNLSADFTIDADTNEDTTQSYELSRIFFTPSQETEPPVNSYRLNIFNALKINPLSCSLADAFHCHKDGDPTWKPTTITISSENLFAQAQALASSNPTDCRYIYGKQTLELDDDWQAIASLNPNEVMTHLHISPASAKVEIRYAQRDNLYFMRSTAECRMVDIDFILQIPTHPYFLPEEIQSLIEAFNAYGSGPLQIQNPEPTGVDYLNALLSQKKGACRHRAVAFKTIMDQRYPDIPSRIVTNDCHAFVEIFYQDQWITCDLGGYAAQLHISEHNSPAATHTTTQPVVTDHVESEDEEATNIENRLIEHYQQVLQKQDPEPMAMSAYCHRILMAAHHEKKRLIRMTSTEALKALAYQIQRYAHDRSQPLFLIQKPEDMVCTAPLVKRQVNPREGKISPGPGGPLYQFITQSYQAEKPPILLINFEGFSADEIVSCNALFDDIRKIDKVRLPESMIIISLMNSNKPGCYQGADFISRHDVVESCPVPMAELLDLLPPSPFIYEEHQALDATTESTINLYHASDWKERLLGRWIVDGDRLYFSQGELVAALSKSHVLEIKNGLWDNEQFMDFWQQALLYKKIEYEGETITLPVDFKLKGSEGYNWPALLTNLTIQAGYHHEGVILNPGSFITFFTHHHCEESLLKCIPGKIETYAHQELKVNLTRSLDENEWAMFLDECQRHQVRLQVYCSPSVLLTPVLNDLMPRDNYAKPAQIWDEKTIYNTHIMTSNDIDTSIDIITYDASDWLIIDVSECNPEDLLTRVHADFNSTANRFEFQQTQLALIKALNANKKVILKGDFNELLIDALMPLLSQRYLNPHEAKGILTLLPQCSAHLSFLPLFHHTVTTSSKHSCLQRDYPDLSLEFLTPEQLERENLSQLKARILSKAILGEESSDHSWQGLYELPCQTEASWSFDPAKASQVSQTFNLERLEQVNKILTRAPYVFLTGQTGVGKSTFVTKILANQDNTCVYQGESRIQDWAQDRTEGTRKILFIDEANLSPRNWSEFEGLFQKEPGILIQGEYYSLTQEHKVIFAGNPLSYGDERQLASLFIRHGNAVVLNPLPAELIYEEILRPVFANSPLSAKVYEISQPILAIYVYLVNLSHTEICISPRELQMMALLTLAWHHHSPDANPLHVAQYYAYQIGRTLIAKHQQSAFEERFALTVDIEPDAIYTAEPDFFITPSRQNVYSIVNDMLMLSQMRKRMECNEQQRHGGLGGLVLEGGSGIGKSQLVISILKNQNYQEINEHSTESVPLDRCFYSLPASMQCSEKRKLLLRAFHEGAIVVIDEMNSTPMMERLLNDLLMGKTPEGERPQKPGFMIIGTQNPTSMAGRRAPSMALARRLLTLQVPTYSADEIKTILQHKGMDELNARTLAEAHRRQCTYAKAHHLEALPTFRDVLNVAQSHLSSSSASSSRNHAQLRAIKRRRGSDEGQIREARKLARSEETPYLTGAAHPSGFFTHSPRPQKESLDDASQLGASSDLCISD